MDDTTQTPDLITQLRSCAAHVHHAEAQALLWTAADILAALERWYRADGRLDFPDAEAELLTLCAGMFGGKEGA